MPNAWFSPTYYLAQNTDVAASDMTAYQHFVLFGIAELRNPNITTDLTVLQNTNTSFADAVTAGDLTAMLTAVNTALTPVSAASAGSGSSGLAFTLTSSTDAFSGSSGGDTFTTTEANFAAADGLVGGSGDDTLTFSDAATVTTAEMANKGSIEVIDTTAANSSITFDGAGADTFVNAADSDTVTLSHGTRT